VANLRIAEATRNAMLDALRTAMDAGSGPATCKVYTASQPANANTAVSGQTLLATLTFSDPAGAGAASGVLTFSAITEDSSADDSGTAAWARIADSAGNTIFDCDVGTSSATLILNTTTVVAGGVVRITSGTITIPAA